MVTDIEIEQEIQDKGLTAPRVTLEGIEANIVSENWFTAEEAVTSLGQPANPALGLLTLYVLTLRNGFTVVGKSACASPENFDADLGRKIARQDAVNQLWPLEGYRLKSELANREKPALG